MCVRRWRISADRLLNSRSHSTAVEEEEEEEDDDDDDEDDDGNDGDELNAAPAASVKSERNIHRHLISPFTIGSANVSTC